MLVYYIYNAFPPFLAARQSTRNWRGMTSFVSLLPRKRSSVPVRFHRLNCSSVVAIVAEIVETTIFLLPREVENKIYKGGIVWISECYLSKMSSHVILSYPPWDGSRRSRRPAWSISSRDACHDICHRSSGRAEVRHDDVTRATRVLENGPFPANAILLPVGAKVRVI